ncbi:MAG: DUF4262 domain-containing protein [Candidatus Eremiobacteraeota bacterium]|nr:DUF4262 domain-containing protein [Candidatus Eremiobacteraeota bacterium]
MRAVTALALVLLFAAPLRATAANAASKQPTPDAPRYSRATDQVKHQGWSCIAVTGNRPENGFAYSMGLSGKQLPELGIFGTDDPSTACAAVDRVARALFTAGRAPRNGAEIFRNADGRVVLRAVLRKEFFERCALARRWRDEHHIKNARAMQIVVLAPGEPIPR